MKVLSSDPSSTDTAGLLACPRCHGCVARVGQSFACQACGSRMALQDGVVIAGASEQQSFFDDKFETMEKGHREGGGEWKLCYEQQVEYIERVLQPGSIVLDVGCGPALSYKRAPGCIHVGIEPSLPSIRANQQLDLRIYGSANAIPIADQSVDVIICLYSVHHMIGQTISQNRELVRKAFAEFGRIIRPPGHILVFEMIPWLPLRVCEDLMWNAAKRQLQSALDMYFWSDRDLNDTARPYLGTSRKVSFPSSPWLVFPPVFGIPSVKVPRFVYPLSPALHHWIMSPIPGHQRCSGVA